MAWYAHIASPLIVQLRKDKFGWSREATMAFQALKHAMTTAPVLAMPDFMQPFVIEMDASGSGLGVVLLQGETLVAFFRHYLGVQARQKSIYERELMAIALLCSNGGRIAWGVDSVRIDQQSLKVLLE